MSELNGLIARVEALSGADREVDGVLMALTYTQDERHLGTQEGSDFGGWEPVKDSVWIDPKTDKWVSTAPFSYTSSIDAALAFAERVLPGWDYILGRTNDGLTIHCQMGPGDMVFGETLPLAIILATLKAKVAE